MCFHLHHTQTPYPPHLVCFLFGHHCPTFDPPHPSVSHPAGGEDSEARGRDMIRIDRKKDRQHDKNISRAAPDKRCWTDTLKCTHLLHTLTLTVESFMGAAVTLNKNSRILQSTQAVLCLQVSAGFCMRGA